MRKMLVMLALAGLLLLGCVGQPSTTTGGTTGATAGAGASAGAGAAAGGAAGNNNQAASGGTSGGAGAGAGTDIATIATYTAAVATGLPLECTVTTNGQATTIDVKGEKMHMSGTAGGQAYEMVYTNGVTYMKLSTDMKSTFAQMGKNCDWLTFAANASSTAGSASAPVSAENVQKPDVVWSCKPGAFGDEKFLTPGSYCSMNDLYPGAGAGAGGSVPSYPAGGY